MEFCILAPQLRSSLDSLLIQLCSDQYQDMKRPGDDLMAVLENFSSEMSRVQSWSKEMESGERVFKRELKTARKMLEEKALASFRPSRELDEYVASSISNLSSKGPSAANLQSSITSLDYDRAEKQGWLFVRTLSGKPTRTVWVRRWYFVKNCIFGWLVPGIRTGGVEESERIGVLLCNVRPATQEERRFCFELKTKDNTMLLQAENQAELVSWLEAFDAAKKAAVDDNTDRLMSAGGLPTRDAAFAVNPPSAPEFAVRSTESHGYHASDDLISYNLDRVASSSIGERDGSSSQDAATRRSTTNEREGDGLRDNATRIIQKLDLHRKTAAGSQLAGGNSAPPSAGLGTPTSGIAGLISTSQALFSVPPTPGLSPIVPAVSPRPSSADPTRSNFGVSWSSIQSGAAVFASSLAPPTLISPPAQTNLSKTAVIVSGERLLKGGRNELRGGVPTGLMANFWGTVSSPIINRLERVAVQPEKERSVSLPVHSPVGSPHSGPLRDNESRSSADQDTQPASTLTVSPPSPSPTRGHRKTITLGTSTAMLQRAADPIDDFPSTYPPQLKLQDAQFRLLFPTALEEDKVLMVFRATWNPTNEQDFPTRVYVTAKKVYFYSHHLGLVLTSSIGLGSIDEVTAAPANGYDFLFLHLREGESESGFTRITIKLFVEPLRLLQRRLNFLVKNFNSYRPSDVETILNNLIKMESDESGDTPSLESWEDVSIGTPVDPSLSSTKADMTRRDRDLRTTIRIDRGLQNDSGGVISKNEVTRFKLPPQPVVYAPENMTKLPVEKEFDISAKALFHVMFGDKSTVFQMLYHERRAQRQ